MEQAKSDPREGGVEQRALALDHVPVIGSVGRRQPLCGTRDEVGHHCIDGDPSAGDEDPGLSGCPEIRLVAPRDHFSLQRQGSVLLAHRAIGPDGQQPTAWTLDPLAGGKGHRGMANVEQLPLMLLGGFGNFRHRGEAGVEARRDIEPRGQRGDDLAGPVPRQDATGIGDADNHRPGAASLRVGNGQVGEAAIGLAAVKPQLADTPIGTPIDDSLRRLGCELVGYVTKKEEIGSVDLHGGSGETQRTELLSLPVSILAAKWEGRQQAVGKISTQGLLPVRDHLAPIVSAPASSYSLLPVRGEKVPRRSG
jgi:hypothetical protein